MNRDILENWCTWNLLEFVLAISLISFGSNQTFFLPHRITEAASLFWSLRELQNVERAREKEKVRKKCWVKIGHKMNERSHSYVLCVEVMFFQFVQLFYYLIFDSFCTINFNRKFFDLFDRNKKEKPLRRPSKWLNFWNAFFSYCEIDAIHIPHGAAPLNSATVHLHNELKTEKYFYIYEYFPWNE